MITSSLHLAGLAVAVIASLATPAAAQSSTALPTVAASQVKGPTAPAKAWKKVINKVLAFGRPVSGMKTPALLIEETVKDSLGDETTHGIFANVKSENSGTTTVLAVALTITAIKVPDVGAAICEQWFFEAAPSGRLLKATYMKSLTDEDGFRMEDPTVMLDLADPKTKAKLDEMLKFWSTR